MRARELINYLIPPLKTTDSLAKANQWLDELRVSELPVAEDGRFLGFVNDELIYSTDRDVDSVKELHLEGSQCVGYENQHFYDILKKAYSEDCRSVAILDSQDKYLGVVTLEDLVEAFAKTSSISGEGAILVISTNSRDYYLSEICRLVESADLKVLGSHVMANEDDGTKLDLTLKINKGETSYAVSILEANGYRVTESYSQSTNSVHEQERLDQLMNFLKF